MFFFVVSTTSKLSLCYTLHILKITQCPYVSCDLSFRHVQPVLISCLQRHDCKCQVISLGAGFDTLFWNLKASNLAPSKYMELDLNRVSRQKTLCITARKNVLLDALGDGNFISNGSVYSFWAKSDACHGIHVYLVRKPLQSTSLLSQALSQVFRCWTLSWINNITLSTFNW